jgi:3-deoxy-D-manno-octulosonate 8-phosphate phosphatase (KDO 8-P phosphatase)
MGMELTRVIDIFKAPGGTFCVPAEEFREKSLRVRGFIFDWDGVFHSGQKSTNESGTFSEVDSMGINMLRYGYWRIHRELPFTAIISGQQDKTALTFALREHFDAVYTGFKDKKSALDHACAAAGITPGQMAFVFDDIIDLSMAKHCGLRIQVRRPASPLFTEYTMQQGLCDYITARTPMEHAVRECCELLLGVWGNYVDTIESRAAFDADYQAYWKARNNIDNRHYTWKEGQIVLER